ncbi:MarR family winged helix-turn-helix transcriptional regulator [Effusibacillus consociatus]|uniref:MarR family winged helix-turn-helix transcriptional regulator n=1 Tax=Effusibacillus consociatus TaxID=1117041 RepID=A0ABV9Q0J2_9BACL
MDTDQILELRTLVQKFIRLFGLLDPSVTPCGYPLSVSQVLALQELEKQTLTVGELSDKLHLERSSVSRLVDSLVKAGFVRREVNEKNRREVLLFLTEKGKNSIGTVRTQSVRYYQSILNGLSNQQQQQILQSFRMFTDSLSKMRGESE